MRQARSPSRSYIAIMPCRCRCSPPPTAPRRRRSGKPGRGRSICRRSSPAMTVHCCRRIPASSASRNRPAGGAGAPRLPNAGPEHAAAAVWRFRRRAGRPSRRARDHRAQLKSQANRPAASSNSAANKISPASRFDLNSLRQLSGFEMSSRRTCQARCSAKAASPNSEDETAAGKLAGAPDQDDRRGEKQRKHRIWCRSPNSSAVDLMPISASSSRS